jgi:hypothetical protein
MTMRASTLATRCALGLWVALLSGCGLLRTTPPADGDGLPPSRAVQAPAQAGDAPLLRLAPGTLGRNLALEQRIRIEARDENGRPLKRQIETLLEVDAQTLRVVLLYMGQTAAVLEWDGLRLQETRSVWWPSALRGERILSELQLALWPSAAIRAALTQGWTLDADEQTRVLRQDGEPVIQIRYIDGIRDVELRNLREDYRLSIRSLSLEP